VSQIAHPGTALPTKDARSDLDDLPLEVSPDGNPVAVYRVLPAQAEAALIHAAVPPRSSVLELGCGAGRITRELAARGHRVVAVDQSPDMLAHVAAHPAIRTVLADIEALSLAERFDGVLLASYLVNTADRSLRDRFLAACRQHLAVGGRVLIQRIDLLTSWAVGPSASYGPVRVRLIDVCMQGSFVIARLEYSLSGRTFHQDVHAEILDDEAFGAALTVGGLKLDRWLDPERTWAVCTKIQETQGPE
jgi:SAM-dependent methyltransferase